MTLAGGGQPARRLHDVWSDIRRFMNERRPILETTRGCGLHDSLITKEIVRQACPCVSNHVPDTNFPLKNLDRPSQGVKEGVVHHISPPFSDGLPVRRPLLTPACHVLAISAGFGSRAHAAARPVTCLRYRFNS